MIVYYFITANFTFTLPAFVLTRARYNPAERRRAETKR